MVNDKVAYLFADDYYDLTEDMDEDEEDGVVIDE